MCCFFFSSRRRHTRSEGMAAGTTSRRPCPSTTLRTRRRVDGYRSQRKLTLILSVVEGYGPSLALIAINLAEAARSAAMGEIPVELARPPVDGARLQVALLDPGDGQDLAVIAGREDLVRSEQLGKADAAFMH